MLWTFSSSSRLILATLWVVTVLEASGHAQARRSPHDQRETIHSSFDESASKIAALVDELIRTHRVPSYSVGVVFGEELVYAKAFGVTNRQTKEPATPDTLYQIGSVTKTFTATLLAALRDDGLVELDDPVTRYLPPGQAFPRAAGGPEITLRHLATHTAGLPPNPVNRVNVDPPGGPGVMRAYSINELYEGLERTELMRPTGQYGYSNLGFGLLGHALERAAKTPYAQLLEQRVLEPLGMHDTTVGIAPATNARFATPYWPSLEPMVARDPWIFGEISGFGGLTSTVPDLARFLALQFRADEAVAKPIRGASIRELWTPQPVKRDGDTAVGLGWQIGEFGGIGRWVHHGGEVDGFSSFVAFKPEQKTGVIVLTNFGGETANRLATPLMGIVWDWAQKRHAAPPDSSSISSRP